MFVFLNEANGGFAKKNAFFWEVWLTTVITHFASAVVLDFTEYIHGTDETKDKIRKYFFRANIESAVNLFFVLPVFLGVSLHFFDIEDNIVKDVKWSPILVIQETAKVVFYFITFRLWFVFSHSTLHKVDWLRQNVHYVHHFYEHTIACDSLAMHAIEFIFVALFGSALGPVLWPSSSSDSFYSFLLVSIVLNNVVHTSISNHVYLGRHVVHHLRKI